MKPWTWIFQSNPRQWDLRGALAQEPRLSWKVSSFRADIKVGDTVYMWECGARAALLARCTVISPPRVELAQAKYERYALDPKYLDEMCRAELSVDLVLGDPLCREALLQHAELRNQRPIGGATHQGTNFDVPPDPAALLARVVAASGGV